MPTPYLLTVLLVLFGAVSRVMAEGDDWLAETVQSQRTFQAPLNLVALRWGPTINGQQILLARSQTNPMGVPTSVPMINVGPDWGSPFKFIERAAKELINEYTGGNHRLEPVLLQKVRRSIEAALASRDPRAIWYQIHLPAGAFPRPVAATMRAFDSTTFPASSIPLTKSPLEEWLDWDYPERSASPEMAHLELQFAFRNPLPQIRALDAFDHLLREIGSYLDLFYVSRAIPVLVRFITTPDRAKVFQNPVTYGFKKDEQAPTSSALVVLKMSGEEFVRRFGTRLPTWQRMYPDVQLPPNALANSEPLRAALQRKLARAQRDHDCMQKVLAGGSPVGMGFNEPPVFSLEEMPTVLHYLDGLFEALFDAADLPLLF